MYYMYATEDYICQPFDPELQQTSAAKYIKLIIMKIYLIVLASIMVAATASSPIIVRRTARSFIPPTVETKYNIC